MKFGHLPEFNMKNIFYETSYTKCGEGLFPDTFLKNENSAHLWIYKAYRNTLRLNYIPLALNTHRAEYYKSF